MGHRPGAERQAPAAAPHPGPAEQVLEAPAELIGGLALRDVVLAGGKSSFPQRMEDGDRAETHGAQRRGEVCKLGTTGGGAMCEGCPCWLLARHCLRWWLSSDGPQVGHALDPEGPRGGTASRQAASGILRKV